MVYVHIYVHTHNCLDQRSLTGDPRPLGGTAGGLRKFWLIRQLFYIPPAIFSKNWNVFKYTLTWIQHTSHVYMDTFDPISNRNRSIPIMRSEWHLQKCQAYVRMSLTCTWHIRTGCNNFMYFILVKAQQERAFLCLLLQLRRRTAQRLVRSLYLPAPPPQTIRVWMWVRSQDCWERERECCYVGDYVQNAGHYRGNKRSAEK